MRRETEWVFCEPAPGDPHAPSAPPIYQTATFRLEGGNAFDYTRSGNPTRRMVEEQMVRAERGCRAVAFGSGMAAITAVASLVGTGEEILAGTDLYGGTYRLLEQVLRSQGIHVHYADTSDDRALVMGLERAPRLVLIETPTNPFQRITDLARLSRLAHERGALVAVDNSLLSPCLQNPLEWGADLVIHSATKFLSGHGDVTAGVVVAADEALGEKVAFYQNAAGAGLAPFEAWLLARGMKTLPLRIERQQQSAGLLARFLRAHPMVRAVHYPGLSGHPGRDVHFRQARGAGAVIAFETGSVGRSRAIVEKTKLFAVTVSFGGVRSTVSLPAAMSHASIPRELRERRRFPEDLVRLSIGIEHPDDLKEDLARALDGV